MVGDWVPNGIVHHVSVLMISNIKDIFQKLSGVGGSFSIVLGVDELGWCYLLSAGWQKSCPAVGSCYLILQGYINECACLVGGQTLKKLAHYRVGGGQVWNQKQKQTSSLPNHFVEQPIRTLHNLTCRIMHHPSNCLLCEIIEFH